MTEWQDIATAPKDGTRILTICTYDDPPIYEIDEWYVCRTAVYIDAGDGLYRKEMQIFSEGWSQNGHLASHWQPLPPPPGARHD